MWEREQLYFSNSYLTEFEASVKEMVSYNDQPAVILSQTAFYPTGGGQPHDIGSLNDVSVIDVVKDEAHVLHVLDAPLKDKHAVGQIDWKRRFDLMQQHSGQHILSQAILQTTEAATVGFHLSQEYTTIDISRADISDDALFASEWLANQIVYENRPVTARFVSADELPSIPLRKQPNVDGPIRVVTVKDFDWSACGGTHVSHTGEIGIIKIIRKIRKKGGLRLTFLCGQRALRHYHGINLQTRDIANQLSVSADDIVDAVQQQVDAARQARKSIELLKQQALAHQAAVLVNGATRLGNVSIVSHIFDDQAADEVRYLARQITGEDNRIALLGLTGEKAQLIFARSANVDLQMPTLLQVAGKIIGGGGGGTPEMAQGGGPQADKVPEALAEAMHWLEEDLLP